jgi:hypothetical protein
MVSNTPTLSEWEYFHVLEGHLSDALHALVSDGSLPSCPREAVKHIGKNFNKIFSDVQQSQLTITSAAFKTIKHVLYAMHNRQELQWQVVEDAVVLSLRVLKELEQRFNIPTQEGVSELEDLWEQLPRSIVAFSHHIDSQVQVIDLPTFPIELSPQQCTQLAIAVPIALLSGNTFHSLHFYANNSKDDKKILYYLKEILDIPIEKAETTEDSIIVSVPSLDVVASLLPEFPYKGHQLKVRVVQIFALTLHPLPATKNESHVELAMDIELGIKALRIHAPDRANNTITVEVACKEDADRIKQKGIAKLSVIEKPSRLPYIAYLQTPAKSVEIFKKSWCEHFKFVPDPIHFGKDMLSAAFFLDKEQSDIVCIAADFTVNYRKVLIVPYSVWRLKVSLSCLTDRDSLLTAIKKLVPDHGAFSIHIPDNGNIDSLLMAYLHIGDAATKQILLTKEIRATYSPTSATSSQSIPSQSELNPPCAMPLVDKAAQCTVTFSMDHVEGVTETAVFLAFQNLFPARYTLC